MPGRQANSGAAPKRSKRSKANPLKRSLDALAIASHTNPERPRVRQHRLGKAEGPKKARKPKADEGESEDESSSKSRPRSFVKGRFDELDIDEGSDSEGNEWRLGCVGTDEDSDIDSDEAMGGSDEEKFEGFTFRGSSSSNGTRPGRNGCNRTAPLPREEGGDIDLEEPDDTDESRSEGVDDDLGQDAVDLAAMLDDSDQDLPISKKRKTLADDEAGDTSEGSEEFTSNDEDEDESVLSVSDDEESADPAKISVLQNLISSLQSNIQEPAAKRPRLSEANEFRKPSEFGLTSSQKLTVADLLPSVTNPSLKKSLKILSSEGEAKSSGRRNGIPSKLEVPLAKRQQDRLDRSAAYEKSKETLNRWIDTVKHNRRADHLSFPLPDPSGDSTKGARQLLPTSSSQPLTGLECAIQNILQESGLATANRETDEDKIHSFEELHTNKMPLAEVQARRAQLRMARELLFREEVRAKRIKKIKSKAYRRIHRKQRKKSEREARVALEQAGVEISDDDDRNDRRRAEERMGARHRESKWAKAIKGIGKAAWDEDARTGVMEMARRGEELRRRIEGKTVKNSDNDDSDLLSDDTSENGDDSSGEECSGGERNRRRLLRRLERAREPSKASGLDSGSTSKLSSMKFMQKAEASRKAENDAATENLYRELAGEEVSSDEGEDALIGRKKYGLTNRSENLRKGHANNHTTNEFEGDRSEEDEAETELDVIVDTNGPSKASSSTKQRNIPHISRGGGISHTNEPNAFVNPWLDLAPHRSRQQRAEGDERKQSTNGKINSKIKESQMTSHATQSTHDDVIIDPNLALKAIPLVQPSKKSAGRSSNALPNSGKWKSVTLTAQTNDDSDNENEASPVFVKDQELIMRAFAGDDVVEEFEKEKRMTILDEEEKVIDNTLPGWGNWTGCGISKKEQNRNRGKVLTKQVGIKEENRKDAKLDRVIVNEKRVKKNVKYLASTLPHPFETREQYERSLRLPVGPEWTTKDTFQNATKPRVMVKQGRVIDPMSNPFL